MADNSFPMLNYYLSLPVKFASVVQNEQNREISHLRNMLVLTRRFNQTEVTQEIDSRLRKLINRLSDNSES